MGESEARSAQEGTAFDAAGSAYGAQPASPSDIYSVVSSLVAAVASIDVGARTETVLLWSADDLGANTRDSSAFVDLPGRA